MGTVCLRSWDHSVLSKGGWTQSQHWNRNYVWWSKVPPPPHLQTWDGDSSPDTSWHYSISYQNYEKETPLAVHWLRLCASNSTDTVSIPGLVTKIPHASWCSQETFLKKNYEKLRWKKRGKKLWWSYPCSRPFLPQPESGPPPHIPNPIKHLI